MESVQRRHEIFSGFQTFVRLTGLNLDFQFVEERLKVRKLVLPAFGLTVHIITNIWKYLLLIDVPYFLNISFYVLFVRQFRYPLNREIIEIPAGLIENGETPLEAAQRELREETGYKAERWTEMPAIWTSPGFSDEKLYTYFAENLVHAPLKPDDDEDITLLRYSEEEVRSLLDSREPQDAKTLMALAWYLARR